MNKVLIIIVISHYLFYNAATANALNTNNSKFDSKDSAQALPIDFVLFDKNLVQAFNDNSLHIESSMNVHVKILSLVNNRLGVNNPLIQTPFLRVKRRLSSSHPTCSPTKIKTTERQASFLFSAPTGLTMSYRVFSKVNIAKSHPQIFNENGRLLHLNRLKEVNSDLRILYNTRQSYGDILDAQLQEIYSINKVNFTSAETFEKTTELFLSNRGDFLLIAPVILLRSFPQTLKRLHSYEIEGQQPYFTGYLMCNDFPETRQYLQAFNQELFELYKSGEFKKLLMASHKKGFSYQIGGFVDECLTLGKCLPQHNLLKAQPTH